MADRSCAKPEGVVANVLVHVEKLVFHADFYVLKMENEGMIDSSPILLGRPFMMTAKTKIDMHSGDLSMEVDGEVLQFNIYKSMQSSPNTAGKQALESNATIGSAMLCVEDIVERLPQKNVAHVPVMKKSGAADSRAAKPPAEKRNSASMPAKPAKKKKYKKRRKKPKEGILVWKEKLVEEERPKGIPDNQEGKGKVESFLIGSVSWKNR